MCTCHHPVAIARKELYIASSSLLFSYSLAMVAAKLVFVGVQQTNMTTC
jgi:hypothetical protein